MKQKVSKAVLCRAATIKSAKSMYEYLVQNFSQPAASIFGTRANAVQQKCHVFYVPAEGLGAINRNRQGRKFKEVKGMGKWHE